MKLEVAYLALLLLAINLLHRWPAAEPAPASPPVVRGVPVQRVFRNAQVIHFKMAGPDKDGNQPRLVVVRGGVRQWVALPK